MLVPIGDSLVATAMKMTKEEHPDIVPMLFDGPRVFLTRAGQLIDRARAYLLAIEKEHGEEDYSLENLRRFFGIIRTGAGFWNLNGLAGQARVAENYLRHVQDKNMDISPGCIDTLFNSLVTIETLVRNATHSLVHREIVH
jgi:chemotaxis protein histidine kinase CheA